MKGGGLFGFLKSKNSTGLRAGEKLVAAQNSLEKKTVAAAGLVGAINSAQSQDKVTEDAKKAYENQKVACAACTTKLNDLYKTYRNSTMKITDRLRAIGSVGFKALSGTRSNIAASKVNSAIKAVNSAQAKVNSRIQAAADKQRQLDENTARLKTITAQVAASREATLKAEKDAATAAATAAAQVATVVVKQANAAANVKGNTAATTAATTAAKANNGAAKSNLGANMFGSTSFGGSRRKSRASRRRRY
jgi:peptidoglycan hydrolase CwlO-like protein